MTSTQASFLDSGGWLAGTKADRLDRTWAKLFRARCLPLIQEAPFATYYCWNNGRPNVSVRLLIGLLILKELHDLTDQEALDAVDFDVRWQMALGVSMDDAAPCQKTLHNFRSVLLAHDEAQRLFAEITDQLVVILGTSTAKQRLDSSHLFSNMAHLTRLRLFCETHRVFLRALEQHAPHLRAAVPTGVRSRYLRGETEAAPYEDARAEEARRRLRVCARDCWRLVDRFHDVAVPDAVAPAYTLLTRLLDEQCVLDPTPQAAAPDDADVDDPPVPVTLKPAKHVPAGSLQSPHDPDAGYGRKGQGYEAVIAETFGNGERPDLITAVDVVAAHVSDQTQTLPVVEALQARGQAPDLLVADTNFGATATVLTCEADGITVVAPVSGYAPTPAPADALFRAPEFDVPRNLSTRPARCPCGEETISQERYTGPQQGAWVKLVFAASTCASCADRQRCPVLALPDGTYVLRMLWSDAVAAARRREEQTPAFRDTYRWRAGIESTNAELKAPHGLGHLRVRGLARVKLAVCFKALACNCKRAIVYWQAQAKTRHHHLADALIDCQGRVPGAYGFRQGLPAFFHVNRREQQVAIA